MEAKSPKFSQIIPYPILDKLNNILKYVEDYDIWAEKYEETNFIIPAIFKRKIN